MLRGPERRQICSTPCRFGVRLTKVYPVAPWQWLRNQLENKHYVMGNVYGTHLPMRLKMETNILSQVSRLPGIRSSHVGLNTILGRDETIDFEDYLGRTSDSAHCRSASHCIWRSVLTRCA
mmetsp:Transcript_8467/g.26218  ORF Transcript_8467/g.26218 Transcript_8467/m.26218 type:complete len:121 (+) Transcript_8467:334-696(+)